MIVTDAIAKLCALLWLPAPSPLRAVVTMISSLSAPSEAQDEVITSRDAVSSPSRADLQLRALLQAVDSGVLLFEEAGHLLIANDRLPQLLGLSPDAAMDPRLLEARIARLSGNFREPHAFGLAWQERRFSGTASGVEELEMLQPARRVIERRFQPVWDAQGGRAGWLEVYRDITNQRLVHSSLLQTEKMAAIGQLVSGIAHELNNPLTSILGYAQLLRGRGLSMARAADVRRIYDEASRASRIVKNLLLFARETKPERTLVTLNEVVERTLALRGYELNVENIEVELALDAELPPVLADGSQMQQVILNLLVNAEQAIQQGRGSGKIRVATWRADAARVALEISDDGPGISPEVASRVFDPFFTTKAAGVGTGLGLSIVYGIVHEHGGEISLETRPGQGAKFRIELPVAGPQLVSAPAATAEEELPLSSLRALVRTGKRILVVEDEPTVAQLIADVMRDEGHFVETVLDSREALARIAQQAFQLVICDLRMPHLDGQAFYRALVQAESPLKDHIVIVTGDTLAPHTQEFLDRSHLPYVAKPFLVEELKLAVGRAMAGTSNRADAQAEGSASVWAHQNMRKT
jgi:signal transduction histidine kinase/FixJ family two-component response regulator